MAYQIGLTITEAQKEFLKKHKISPSQIIQEKIDSLMEIKDPEMLQKRIAEFSVKDVSTIWQRMLSDEPDFDKRKMIVFDCLDKIGIDTTKWKERQELESKGC